MTIQGTGGPSNPFHLAKAYGVTPTTPAAAPTPVHPPAPARATDGPTQNAPQRPERVTRLVAGVVPGGVDFSGPVPTAGTTSLPFYTNPADQNAAVVAHNLGRGIDVTI